MYHLPTHGGGPTVLVAPGDDELGGGEEEGGGEAAIVAGVEAGDGGIVLATGLNCEFQVNIGIMNKILR